MKIVNSDVSELYIGTVFRFKGKYPFCEEYVDFMLCDYPDCGEICSPFALYCVSGYCAGHLEYVFPLEVFFARPKCTKLQVRNVHLCMYILYIVAVVRYYPDTLQTFRF